MNAKQPMTAKKGFRLPEAATGLPADLAAALRFCSRLPVPRLPGETDPHAPPRAARLARLLPVAGALIGAFGGAVLAGALRLGLGPWLSAVLAVAGLTLATGAFHEDGLADTADGFGGGRTPEARLAIMRDSRIGAFGAAALILAFHLRIAALAALAVRLDPLAAAAAVVLAAAVSRVAQLLPLGLLRPARSDGASAAFGRVPLAALAVAGLVTAGLALVLVRATALPAAGAALGSGLAAAAALGLAGLSRRLIGGQTGDVAGAAQQLAEIAALVGLVIATRP